ncbi:nucleolar protein 12 [Diutina catenulata]
MSSLSSLFGGNTDSKVSELFSSKADGPVDRSSLRKKRTIIEVRRTEPESSDEEEAEELPVEVEKPKKKKRKNPEEDDDLEGKYFENLMADKKSKPEKDDSEDKESADEKEESEEEDAEGSTEEKSAKAKKATQVNLKEDELEKAERTVFVGNVPSATVKSKSTEKAFKKFFSAIGKVDSIRFRSIAFDQPISRKSAFAAKAIHKDRESINAYVVFAERADSKKAVDLNATVFEDHHLRVDHVAHPAPKVNKRTVFVGNLDYDEQEEVLWRYFNKLTDNDVEVVRIIRDAATNLGKGFAYIQFKDSLSVDKALPFNEKPLEYYNDESKKGRKLRIVRTSSKAKPSLWSPNHIENVRRNHLKAQLSDKQKTKLGRAQRILGKADRATAGRNQLIIEGERSQKGTKIQGIKGLKVTAKVKKPRLRERSQKFKEAHKEALDQAKQEITAQREERKKEQIAKTRKERDSKKAKSKKEPSAPRKENAKPKEPKTYKHKQKVQKGRKADGTKDRHRRRPGASAASAAE